MAGPYLSDPRIEVAREAKLTTSPTTFTDLCEIASRINARAGGLVASLDSALTKLGISVPDSPTPTNPQPPSQGVVFQIRDEQLVLNQLLDRFEELVNTFHERIGG